MKLTQNLQRKVNKFLTLFLFESSTQETPQPRGNGATSCYGIQAYDPTKEVICGSRLHDIHDGKTECCAGELINPNVEPCCNDPALLAQSPFSCCGFGWSREAYDPTQFSCTAQGSRIEFPELKVNGPTKLWEQCDGTTYASTLQICCGGHLTPKFPDSLCCGSSMYLSYLILIHIFI